MRSVPKRKESEGEKSSLSALGSVHAIAAGASVSKFWEEETGAAAVGGDSGKGFAAQHVG